MIKHVVVSFVLLQAGAAVAMENEPKQECKIQAFSLLTIELQDGTLIKRLPTGGACFIKGRSQLSAGIILKINGYTFGGNQTDAEFIAEADRYGTIKEIHYPQK